VLIDDQDVGVWKRFTVVHPLGTAGKTIEQYWKAVDGG
jgi:hypothetical protein